jgi:hypothetical protein
MACAAKLNSFARAHTGEPNMTSNSPNTIPLWLSLKGRTLWAIGWLSKTTKSGTVADSRVAKSIGWAETGDHYLADPALQAPLRLAVDELITDGHITASSIGSGYDYQRLAGDPSGLTVTFDARARWS